MTTVTLTSRRPLGGFLLGLALMASAAAAEPVLDLVYDSERGLLRLSLPPDASSYFLLEHSADLTTFTDVSMALGYAGPTWFYEIPVESHRSYFRVRAVNIFAPLDTDGDGIDDRYELEHGTCLNPFDPLDAAQSCLQPGYSNLQSYYRDLYGGGPGIQFFSREASVFNFGAPTARLEAMSSEVSVYNANPGSGPPTTDLNQAFSREATVWNFGSPSAHVEAISPELSVYNAMPGSGPPTTELNQVFSRETTVWNFGSPFFTHDALSREVTVFNFGQPTANLEAISREVTVLNFEESTLP